jgi:hypothetical protein
MRVDKTDSAVGVTRGTYGWDIPVVEYDTVIGVGIDANGIVQKGAANTGIIGVVIPTKAARRAGDRCDIFKLGEIVADPGDVATLGLLAGTVYYCDDVTGALTDNPLGATNIGWTVEASRLVLQLCCADGGGGS